MIIWLPCQFKCTSQNEKMPSTIRHLTMFHRCANLIELLLPAVGIVKTCNQSNLVTCYSSNQLPALLQIWRNSQIWKNNTKRGSLWFNRPLKMKSTWTANLVQSGRKGFIVFLRILLNYCFRYENSLLPTLYQNWLRRIGNPDGIMGIIINVECLWISFPNILW